MRNFEKDALLGLLCSFSTRARRSDDMQAFYALNRAWNEVSGIETDDDREHARQANMQTKAPRR